MKINIIAVGKLKESFWVEAISEYAKRLSRFCKLEITEVEEKKTIEEEGKEILKRLSGCAIVLDINGELVTSENFAARIQSAFNKSESCVTFIIGGSSGLSNEVKNKADASFSFGRVTYPHQLMRVILCEQIYRAFTIINNVTYHK